MKIAIRFLTSSRAQTVLIVLGIAIGVSVQVFVGSLIDSLQKSLVEGTVGNTSQISVVSEAGSPLILDWESVLAEVDAIDAVTVVSVSADSSALISYAGKTEPVIVRGWDFDMADGIYGVYDSIYEGEAPDAATECILGRELVEELSLGIGEAVYITTPSASVVPLEVAGFFDFGVASLNSAWVLTDINTSRQMFGYGAAVTAVESQIKDVFQASTIASELQASLADPNLRVENWMDENEQLLSGLQAQSASSLMIQVFVLTAVVIAIASVLVIKVVQKSRQIGILKAMGIKDRSASLIFLFEGSILGVLGSLMGVSLGLMLLYSFSTFATGSDGSSIIDIYISPSFVIGSGVIAVLAATFAAVVPASKSSRLSPIEVIRNA